MRANDHLTEGREKIRIHPEERGAVDVGNEKGDAEDA